MARYKRGAWLLVTNVKLESSKNNNSANSDCSGFFITILAPCFVSVVHKYAYTYILGHTLFIEALFLVTHTLLDIHSIQPLYIPVSHSHIIHS